MSLSAAAKVSAAVISGIGLPTTIYYSYLYTISLYAVEKEVISEKIKLSRKDESNAGATTITIATPTAADQEEERLSSGYEWSCVIEIEPHSESSTDKANQLWNKLKAKLPVDNKDQNLENKELLVRACARNREIKTNNIVKGKLKIRETSSTSTFSFEQNPELNVLLEATTS